MIIIDNKRTFVSVNSVTFSDGISDGNNWLIVKPERLIISPTFSSLEISTKDFRTFERNLGTWLGSRRLTDSSRNFIGSDISDANTGAVNKVNKQKIKYNPATIFISFWCFFSSVSYKERKHVFFSFFSTGKMYSS